MGHGAVEQPPNFDGFVISRNLAQSRKERKVNLLTLKDIFSAPLASLRGNIVFTSSSILDFEFKL